VRVRLIDVIREVIDALSRSVAREIDMKDSAFGSTLVYCSSMPLSELSEYMQRSVHVAKATLLLGRIQTREVRGMSVREKVILR